MQTETSIGRMWSFAQQTPNRTVKVRSNYVARWYDPAIGRFIQADSIVPNPASAVGFDRYAYTLNNPVKYIDPSGHRPIFNDCQFYGMCTDTGGSDGQGTPPPAPIKPSKPSNNSGGSNNTGSNTTPSIQSTPSPSASEPQANTNTGAPTPQPVQEAPSCNIGGAAINYPCSEVNVYSSTEIRKVEWYNIHRFNFVLNVADIETGESWIDEPADVSVGLVVDEQNYYHAEVTETYFAETPGGIVELWSNTEDQIRYHAEGTIEVGWWEIPYKIDHKTNRLTRIFFGD